MMSSCGQILRSILIGFGRSIHVLGLIVLLLMTIWLLVIQSGSSYIKLVIDRMYNQSFALMSKTVLSMNIVTIAFGILVALFNHRPSLRVYSYASCFLASLVIIYGICASLGLYEGARDNYINELTNYQKLYDWIQVPPESADTSKRREATIAWDELQETYCCGIKEPADWNEFRPKDLPITAFPRSCCTRPKEINESLYCIMDDPLVDFYKSGCLKVPDALWSSATAWLSVLAIIQLLLGLLSLFIDRISDQSLAPNQSISRQQITMDLPNRY